MEKEQLYRYFNNQTNIEENIQIMDWVESSNENKKTFEEERMIWMAMIMYSKPQTEVKSKPSFRRSIYRIIYATAAIALIIFGLFSTLWNNNTPEYSHVVNVPSGQRVEIILPDGTEVWLNSNTRLEYSSCFGTECREVRLSGEGYFDVVRNENLPFIVHTSKYDVEVLGTVFNVMAYDSSDMPFETSLISGSVKITSEANDSAIILSEKQCAIEVADGSLLISSLSDFAQFSWKDGVLSLTDVTFTELIQEFSRYYGVTISLTNPSLSDKRCTGKFRNTDGVVHSLNVLKILIGFEYSYDIENNTITIW